MSDVISELLLFPDYKEKVKCQSGKEAFRACDKVERIEDRKFWMFEFVCALIGAVSASVVFLRQKQLDHKKKLHEHTE